MKRWLVVGALFVLSVILYIDRVCISAAKGAIASDLQIGDEAMGMVFGAFALGYAFGQMPTGYLADRFGPRRVLAAVVTLWSLFTALTGAASGLASLIAIRFIFGLGEAGAFPGAARAYFSWLRTEERGLANGLMFSGTRLGGALAFPLLPWMLGLWGWRMSFVLLGGVGVVWVALWLVWFRDTPQENAATPAATEGGGPSYGEILRSRGMRLAMAQYFASNFTFFICLSWMLPYLEQRFRLSAAGAAGYAMIPLLVAATSQWVAGFMVDRLYRSRLRSWSRRLPAAAGFGIAAVGVASVTAAETPAGVVACFTLAVFGADMTISPSWAFCVDIGGKGAGTVSGAMNMVGNIGSFASASTFPVLLRMTGSASAYFWLAAVLDAAALACWVAMKPQDIAANAARASEPAASQ